MIEENPQNTVTVSANGLTVRCWNNGNMIYTIGGFPLQEAIKKAQDYLVAWTGGTGHVDITELAARTFPRSKK